MNTKTPVTILQELMTHRHSIVHYDLLSTEGMGTHMPIFRYRIVVDDNICAFGSAGSKKEAKHDAAKHMLEKLQEMGMYCPKTPVEPSVASSVTPPTLSPKELSPTKIQVNSIGMLQDFCFENNVPKPEFTLLADIGPPHLRQFTFECKVASIAATATELTKKKAKQSAAQKMLERLLDTLPEQVEQLSLGDCMEDSLEEHKACYREISPNVSKKKIDFRQTISSYSQTIRKLMEEKNVKFEDLWEKDLNPEDLFKSMLEKLEVTCNIEYYDCASSIMAIISMQTSPEFVVCEYGKTKDEAFQAAVEESLQFLRVMSK